MKRSVCSRSCLIVVVGLLAVTMFASAASCAEDAAKWQWEITPYYWLASTEGDAQVRGVSVPVDVSFSDIADKVDVAFSLHVTARKPDSHWGGLVDFMFLNLEDERSFAAPAVVVHVDSDMLIGEVGCLYSPKTDLELREAMQAGEKPIPYALIGGVRIFRLENSISVSPGSSGSLEDSWVEPMIGVVTQVPVSGKLSVAVRGDIGGFSVGESKFTANALVDFRYQFSKKRWANLGYRLLSIDTIDNGQGVDITFAGPVLGITTMF